MNETELLREMEVMGYDPIAQLVQTTNAAHGQPPNIQNGPDWN